MNLDDYQSEAETYFIGDTPDNYISNTSHQIDTIAYCVMGLSGEVGEISELNKKFYRNPKGCNLEQHNEQMLLELGDVLWYLSMLAREYGYNMGDVAEANLKKLQKRKELGTIGAVNRDE